MALLRSAILAVLIIISFTLNADAHTGRIIPLCCGSDYESRLIANLVSSYISEQMGRDVRVVNAATEDLCFVEMQMEKAPLSVLKNQNTAENDIYVKVGPVLISPFGDYVVVMGQKASEKLIFSLVPQYLARLSEAFGSLHLGEALQKVKSGEGARKVAIDVLREADLL